MNLFDLLSIPVNDILSTVAILCSPFSKESKDAFAKPYWRRFLRLAFSLAITPTQHHSSDKVDPVPGQGQDRARSASGLEAEQDKPFQMFGALGCAQQSIRLLACQPFVPGLRRVR